MLLQCFDGGPPDYEGSNVDHDFEALLHGFSSRSIGFVPPSLTTTHILGRLKLGVLLNFLKRRGPPFASCF
jgi:hypothetical protein